jgi:hypothetical protein
MTDTPTRQAKVPVTAGLDPAVIRHLDLVVKRDDRSRADIIRRAIDEFLARDTIANPVAPTAFNKRRGSDPDAATRAAAARGRRTGR